MSLAALLTETGSVYAKADGRGETGGATRTPALRAADQPCRVQDASASQRLAASSLGLVITHMILTEYAGTQNGDTWVVSGATYRVVGIKLRRAIGSLDDHYAIDAEEVQN